MRTGETPNIARRQRWTSPGGQRLRRWSGVPATLFTKRKDVMNRYIIGTGDHVYQVVHSFGELPQGMTFGNTSHVATDSIDRVYVYQRQDPPILVFDTNGSLLNATGGADPPWNRSNVTPDQPHSL